MCCRACPALEARELGFVMPVSPGLLRGRGRGPREGKPPSAPMPQGGAGKVAGVMLQVLSFRRHLCSPPREGHQLHPKNNLCEC